MVSLFFSQRFRGVVAMALAALVLSIGVRPALAGAKHKAVNPPTTAADTDSKSPAYDDEKPTSDQSDDSTKAPAEAVPAPRLQLQDEGPPAETPDAARLSSRASRARIAATDDADERPFWKSWIFWSVTGALVVGAIGLAAYSSSHSTSSSLAPCPVDVVVSLGCFGAGRGQ